MAGNGRARRYPVQSDRSVGQQPGDLHNSSSECPWSFAATGVWWRGDGCRRQRWGTEDMSKKAKVKPV